MKITQFNIPASLEFTFPQDIKELNTPLVFVFGERKLLEKPKIFTILSSLFPNGHLVFASTSGNIIGDKVLDDGIVVTAVEFEKSTFLISNANILETENQNSYKAGLELMQKLPKENLKHVIVISEGSFINGSLLAKGLHETLDTKVKITGALCGDGNRFESTIASYNQIPKKGEIIIIGFYGETLEVSFSINGGWIPFGPQRKVTKAKNNILYEIDHKPALELYKKYLGDKAENLPSAALYFPLKITNLDDNNPVVRTILNINEKENAMILAGNINENDTVQLMMTNKDKIIYAAEEAAIQASKTRKKQPQLGFLVSCIGRKLVLDQRVEEEIESVLSVVGSNTNICGLYSYGEIAPFNNGIECHLHNQTMAITLMSE